MAYFHQPSASGALVLSLISDIEVRWVDNPVHAAHFFFQLYAQRYAPLLHLVLKFSFWIMDTGSVYHTGQFVLASILSKTATPSGLRVSSTEAVQTIFFSVQAEGTYCPLRIYSFSITLMWRSFSPLHHKRKPCLSRPHSLMNPEKTWEDLKADLQVVKVVTQPPLKSQPLKLSSLILLPQMQSRLLSRLLHRLVFPKRKTSLRPPRREILL